MTEQELMLKELNPLVKTIFKVASNKCVEEGYSITVLETFRTKDAHHLLYCRGRSREVAKKAGISDYILNIAYTNPDTESMDKVTNSLSSSHFYRKALDVEVNKINEVIPIFESYGFTVSKVNKRKLHLELSGHFENKFKYRLCTHEVVNAIRKVFNQSMNMNLPLNGFWDNEFKEALKKYKKKFKIGSPDDGSIDVVLLEDILKKL